MSEAVKLLTHSGFEKMIFSKKKLYMIILSIYFGPFNVFILLNGNISEVSVQNLIWQLFFKMFYMTENSLSDAKEKTESFLSFSN